MFKRRKIIVYEYLGNHSPNPQVLHSDSSEVKTFLIQPLRNSYCQKQHLALFVFFNDISTRGNAVCLWRVYSLFVCFLFILILERNHESDNKIAKKRFTGAVKVFTEEAWHIEKGLASSEKAQSPI